MIPAGCKKFYLLQKLLQTRSEVHPAPIINEEWRLFPQGSSGQGAKLSTHLHLVLKVRKHGVIPPLHIPS
jgi:hypothetical protein